MNSYATDDIRIEFPAEFKNGECLSLGRNGSITTIAIDVIGGENRVALAPVTSKCLQGRCRIELPRDRETLETLGKTLLDIAAQCR